MATSWNKFVEMQKLITSNSFLFYFFYFLLFIFKNLQKEQLLEALVSLRGCND